MCHSHGKYRPRLAGTRFISGAHLKLNDALTVSGGACFSVRKSPLEKMRVHPQIVRTRKRGSALPRLRLRLTSAKLGRVETKEILKIGILLFLYFIIPPMLAILLRGKRWLQRIAFFAMCFMSYFRFVHSHGLGGDVGVPPGISRTRARVSFLFQRDFCFGINSRRRA